MKEGGEEGMQSSPSPAAPAAAPATSAPTTPTDRKSRGIGGMIWSFIRLLGSLFSWGSKNDFEKRLQHLNKEEVAVHTRLKRRTQRWRKLARVMIIYSILGEALALGFAILSTRTDDLPWQVRAMRALPVFALPAVVTLLYSTCAGYNRIMERKDKERLERLKAERQEKINELKEKTNYYITQQLIQQYDPDPAAKAAAASILASKLGAESGLKLAYAAGLATKDDLTAQGMKPNEGASPPGAAAESMSPGETADSMGLRNRRPQHRRQSVGPAPSQGMQRMEGFTQEMNARGGMDPPEVWDEQQGIEPPRNNASDGGWVARLAAMLVGEDPTQCYALICKNCHAHNGLAKKEDYQYIQYYCPRCRTLNGTPVGDGLQLTDGPGELSPKQEPSNATSSVEGSRSSKPEISNSAAPAPTFVSQLISGELEQADSSSEESTPQSPRTH